jgi:CBS domain-containing protein
VPLVSEHMTRSLLTVSADASLGEAAASMAERGVGAVVVLEGGSIAAILTERDVMKAVAAGKDGSASVIEWMTRHPDTIEPSDTTDHAASLMIHGGFRHLPVVEDGKVVGIVSIRDLTKWAAEELGSGHEMPDIARSQTALKAASELQRQRQLS